MSSTPPPTDRGGDAAATTYAWLIESGPDARGSYWWWASPGWVPDALRATRYATKGEAEIAMGESNLTARVLEHGFMGSVE